LSLSERVLLKEKEMKKKPEEKTPTPKKIPDAGLL